MYGRLVNSFGGLALTAPRVVHMQAHVKIHLGRFCWDIKAYPRTR